MKGGEKQLRVAMVGQKTILSRKGGVEVVVKELSERMVKKGIIVTCYNRREKGEERPKEYKGIKMKYAWTIRVKGLAALTSSFFATIMILFSKNDVVHYHAEGPCAWMWIIKFFSKKRIVATIHGLDWQQVKWGKIASSWIRKGEKTAVKYADEIIVLNAKTQDYFMKEYNRKTLFIPNGVSEPDMLPARIIKEKYGLEKDDYILYLGRIIPGKGINYLIDAYNQMNTKKKLVIAGGPNDDSDYYNEMQEKSSKNAKIILTGFVDGDELKELYSNAFIYTLPSDHEGMPLSLLEAMSYGNYCVVSDIDECTSVIGDNGTVFKKSNVEDLAINLDKLIMKPEIVKKNRTKVKHYVTNKYNWDNVVVDIVDMYHLLRKGKKEKHYVSESN